MRTFGDLVIGWFSALDFRLCKGNQELLYVQGRPPALPFSRMCLPVRAVSGTDPEIVQTGGRVAALVPYVP